MALVCPDEGEKKLLDVLTADRTNWQVRLFRNDRTPADADTLADYTEATFSGYAAVACPAFAAASTNAITGKAEAVASAYVTFAHNGGGTGNSVYGWYLVRATDSKLLFAERFADAPRVMALSGDEVTLGIVLALSRDS